MDITNLIQISDKAVVVGYSGSGKTTFMKHYIKHSKLTPMYIIDPIGNFSPNVSWKNYNYSGIIPCADNIKNHTCIKMHDINQFETFVWYLSNKKEKWFLVVDEIDRFLDIYPAPFYSKRYLEEGRNWGRGGMFSVRRIGFLNKSILGNARYLIMFRINNLSDMKYLMSIVDIPYDLQFSDEHSFYVFDLFKSENLGEFKINP